MRRKAAQPLSRKVALLRCPRLCPRRPLSFVPARMPSATRRAVLRKVETSRAVHQLVRVRDNAGIFNLPAIAPHQEPQVSLFHTAQARLWLNREPHVQRFDPRTVPVFRRHPYIQQRADRALFKVSHHRKGSTSPFAFAQTFQFSTSCSAEIARTRQSTA